MKRMGFVIGIAPDEIERYKERHGDVPLAVLERLRLSHVTNYSIFIREPENLMFGYWEYVGEDYEADMAAIAADPATQDWWEICGPMQRPLQTREDGEWWASMKAVFHME